MYKLQKKGLYKVQFYTNLKISKYVFEWNILN